MTLGGVAPGLANVNAAYQGRKFEPVEKEPAFDEYSLAGREAEKKEEAVIGLGMLTFGNNGMRYDIQAQYAPDSTGEDPIVRVMSKNGDQVTAYDIHINDVNPRNATQLELFALLSYADALGNTRDGNLSTYQRVMTYAENAKQNGHWEGTASYDEFLNQKQDWQQIIIDMWDDYADAGLYSQKLNCMELNSTMERFSIRFVDFDSITFVDRTGDTYLSHQGPEMPEDVRIAWYEAAEETGIEDFGRDSSGLFLHLSERILQRMMKWQQEDESGDTISSSIDSALKAAREALRALEYPLTPGLMHSSEVQEEIEKEKEFYEAFIRKLEAMQRPSEADRNSEAEAPADYRQILQDYIKKLYDKGKNGDTEVVYQIGGQAYTEQEWEKLLEQFDSAEEEIQKQIEEEKLRIIAVDKAGIRCGRPDEEDYEWEIQFTDESQYEQTLELLQTDFQLSDLLTLSFSFKLSRKNA
ncbi:MAG: hypothetical protein K2N24_11975 [Lachnospiraceae bacterium]|nr:hypothetical protein [Lachnospiraceae bacterium]